MIRLTLDQFERLKVVLGNVDVSDAAPFAFGLGQQAGGHVAVSKLRTGGDNPNDFIGYISPDGDFKGFTDIEVDAEESYRAEDTGEGAWTLYANEATRTAAGAPRGIGGPGDGRIVEVFLGETARECAETAARILNDEGAR